MTSARVVVARVLGVFARKSLERRLNEEIESHLEMLVEENLRRGMNPVEARQAARREFGGLEQMKETYRDGRGVPWLETTARDGRYALRLLRKSPAFTAVAVSVLALGIGATTTVFSLGNTLFSGRLPYPEAEQLVLAGSAEIRNGRPAGTGAVSLPDFSDWRAQNEVFAEMAAWRPEMVNANLGRQAVRVEADRVSGGFFPLLGVAPFLGRCLGPEDFAPGAPTAIVLSHSFWKANLGARPFAVGETIRIEGRPAVIAGVMPPRFRSPGMGAGGRIWLPLPPSEKGDKRDLRNLQVVARLRANVHLDRARRDMDTIAARLDRQYPDTNKGWTVRVEGMIESITGAANTNLGFVLRLAGAFVLIMACANVANLLLARDVERRKEIALRMAVGAGRLRLVRQFLVESTLLGLAGGACGLALTQAALTLLSRSSVRLLESFGVERFAIDARVLGYALAVSLGTALLFGLFSAISSSRFDLSPALNEGSRTVSAGRPRRRLARALVVVEITLALMLLSGAAFILKGVFHFWRIDWGFPTAERLALTVSLSESTHASSEKRLRYFEEAVRKAAAVPGIRSAAVASSIPVELSAAGLPVKIFDSSQSSAEAAATATVRSISPDYLRTLSIPLVHGRVFDDRDTSAGPKVAVVNAAFAKRFWKGDALGARIGIDGQIRTIVGISGDVLNRGLFRKAGYEVLVPVTQSTPSTMTLIAHTVGDPGAQLEAMAAAVRAIDPDQPVYGVQTLASLHRELCRPLAIVLIPLVLFGGSSLLLATVGIYGVISHAVSARGREIGIRMALGAAKGRVVSQILGDGVRLTVKGLLLGSLGGFAIMRLLAARVWWLSGTDVQWLLHVAVLLAAVALAACYVPAVRAARIDPVVTLRNE